MGLGQYKNKQIVILGCSNWDIVFWVWFFRVSWLGVWKLEGVTMAGVVVFENLENF